MVVTTIGTPVLAIGRTYSWVRIAGDISKSVNTSAPHLIAAAASTGGTAYPMGHGLNMVDPGGAAIPIAHRTAVVDFGAIVARTYGSTAARTTTTRD